MQKNHKILIGLLIVLGIAVLVMFMLKKQDKSESNKAQNQSAVVEKVNVDFKEDPKSFPSDIPIETGAKLTQNYNATTPAGQFQATKVFVSKLSLSDNLKLYTDYFTRNGWTTSGVVDQQTYKSVTGTKDGNSVQVSIDENKTSKAITVSLIYFEKLKSGTK